MFQNHRGGGGGDEVEGRLTEGCQGIVVRHSCSSPRPLMLGLRSHGEGMVSLVLWVRAHSLTHSRSSVRSTTPCSCEEPGPAWPSCYVTEMRGQTDEPLEVNTVFKVSPNVSTRLSNSVPNFFFPQLHSLFCVAHSDGVIYLYLFILSFFPCRSIVVDGLALPAEYLLLAGLF